MDTNYELVHYHPDLKSQVIALQTHLWSPGTALNAAYFEWKYERNPYHSEPLIYLAMHQGQAVGMRGFFGIQWEGGIPTQKFGSLYADDTVIAPEHRDRGLMPQIMTAAFKDLKRRGYDYLFNLSAGPMTFLSSLSMGWRSAGSVQPMHWQPWRVGMRRSLYHVVRRFPPAPSLRRLLPRKSEKTPQTRLALDQSQGRQTFKAMPWIVYQEVPRCTAMSELVERLGNSGRLRHVKDSQYFEWRFQNPLSRYRFLFWEKDRLEGYMVLQAYTSEFANRSVVNMVDWECSRPAVLADLLEAACTLVKVGELVVWSATLSRDTISLFREKGFKPLQQTTGISGGVPAILLRPLRSEPLNGDWQLAGRRLLDMANWDLRMLYSMCG